MTARQTPLPRRWLMTDERLGDALWEAIARLPEDDSGIVFRHYSLGPSERRGLACEVAAHCRSRGIVFAVAGDCDLARELGADLVHNPRGACVLPFSRSVHGMDDAADARAAGAALVFVSPVYPTGSHPGDPALGPLLAAQVAMAAQAPAIALGGMDEARFAALPPGAFHGWAGIGAWTAEGISDLG